MRLKYFLLYLVWLTAAFIYAVSSEGRDYLECRVYIDKNGTYLETGDHLYEIPYLIHCEDCECGEEWWLYD